MVVFTCNNCGESLQKARVEKHKFKCRKALSVTCVDCHKDFGLDYVEHIKCMTEKERYSAKGSVTVVQKGEIKQNNWVVAVTSVLENIPHTAPDLKEICQVIINHNNIPRKEKKFINFVHTIKGKTVQIKTIQKLWNLIQEKLKNSTLDAKTNGANPQEGNKKRKANEESEISSETTPKKKKKKTDNSNNGNEVKKSMVETSKKKKQKSKHNDASVSNDNAIEPSQNDTTQVSKKKKKKKPKNKKSAESNGDAEISQNNDKETNAAGESAVNKKIVKASKMKQKSKLSQNDESTTVVSKKNKRKSKDAGLEVSNNAKLTGETPSKKKKSVIRSKGITQHM